MPRIVKPGMESRAKIQARIRKEKREAAKIEQKEEDAKILPMKKPSGNGAATVMNIETQEDISFVVQFLRDGYDMRSIAQASEEVLGRRITPARARRLWQKEIARFRDPGAIKEIRAKEDARLDYYLTQLAGSIKNGDVSAIGEARKISESRRRMWGADMPTNVRVTGEVVHSLDPSVQASIEAAKERQAQRELNDRNAIEDGRIIEAEIVSDNADPDFKTEAYQEDMAEYEFDPDFDQAEL